LWSIPVKLVLSNLLRAYSACWWNISELAPAMIQPTGVRDSGLVIVVDIDSRYAGCNNNMGVEVTWLDIKN
jgi:hypothetical protein